MSSSSGPVVLITGCTSGIGLALVGAFAASSENGKPYRIFASARGLDKLKTALNGAGLSNVEMVQLDVCDGESIKKAIEEVTTKTGGSIDYLINNAGTNTAVGPLVETDLSRFRSTFEANYFGLIAVTQAVAPHMIKKRSGKIINIGSTAGLAPLPYSSAYSSSKAAVHAISDVLRLELRGFGIKVVVVAPGAIKSSIGDAGTKDISIPETSNYKNVADMIAFRAVYSQNGSPTPTDQFAQLVLKACQPKLPRAYIVAGAKSSLVMLLYYLPAWVKDSIFSRIFQMGRIGTNK